MKVLVTGANGFVGKHCCALLRSRGIAVTAPSSLELDITSPFTIKQHIDAVIHLAAYNITSVGDQDEAMYRRVNVDGTRHVIKGVSCDHFILLSTAKVDENPRSLYAQSKAAAEAMCRTHFKGSNLTIIRSVNILGPGQAPKAVLPVFIAKARANEPLSFTVNPLTPLLYIDVRDCAEIIFNLVEHPHHGGVYYTAYPHAVTLHDLALKVIAACGSSSTVSVTAAAVPVDHVRLDCQNTWDTLGFKPRYDIDDILKSILQ